MLNEIELKKLITDIFFKQKDSKKGREFSLFTNDIKTVEMFNKALAEEAKRLNIKFDDKEEEKN